MATELSKHPTKGFRLSLSYYTTKDGKRSPKVFWLGHREREAKDIADMIRYAYREMFSEAEWTDESLAVVKKGIETLRAGQQDSLRGAIHLAERAGFRVIEGPKVTPDVKAATTTSTADTAGKNLYAAIDAYTEGMKNKQLSNSHRLRATKILDALKLTRPDVPMVDIDYLWIDRLCDEQKKRPVSGKTGKPISPATVATVLRYWRSFFGWADDTTFGGWVGPRKLLLPFRVRKSDVKMTPAEMRASATIKQFDIPTLVKLFKAGSPAQQTWMLTAIFAGATQQELAVMEKEEFDLAANKLVHHRNKTGVVGQFWLPPQLMTLLRDEFKRHRNSPLAFQTADGKPLVWFQANGKLGGDAVRLSWNRLRIKAGLPNVPSFKYLRKYSADYAVRHGGESIAQTMLSHARATVLAKNYSTARDFAQLAKIQKRMHVEFTKAGMFTVTKTPTKGKKK